LGEPDTAVSRLRTAADLHVRAGDEHAAIQALERAGDLGTIAALPEAAGSSLLTALEICETFGAGRSEKARLHRKLAELFGRWGFCDIPERYRPERFRSATKYIDAALAMTEADPFGEDRCRILSTRAFVRCAEGDYVGAEADARAALALAPHGSPAWFQAMDALSGIFLDSGRLEEALASDLERVPVAEQLGDAIEINDAYRGASVTAMRAGKFQDAERYARLSEEPVLKLGIPGFVRLSRTVRANALLHLQRWQEAFDIADALVADPLTATDHPTQPVMRRFLLAEACAHLGQPQRARSLLEEAGALPGFPGPPFFGLESQERALRAIEAAERAGPAIVATKPPE
jgi:tetratricopeptide (TPR) repeat protein